MAETLSSLQDLKGATAAPQPEAPHYVQKLDAQGRAYATGKRKDAVARVWIKPGSGKVVINGRALEVYFARPVLRMILQQPLGVAKRVDQYDLTAPSPAAAFRARPARCATASPRRSSPSSRICAAC